MTLEDCECIFETFRRGLEFDEPIPPFKDRFEGRLESILGTISQTYNQEYLNPTVLEAAANYFNLLVRSQTFRNGNKRMAILFTHVFLLRNGVDFTLSYKEMYNFAVIIAKASEQKILMADTKNLCQKIISDFTTDRVN
ncbi:MAG TPA: hypothetical protein DDZ05_03705 [Candidatus Blackburnbacteria bacterium]|nr:hypothetical protein [Candidatus Blackburnbacteria bacterium]